MTQQSLSLWVAEDHSIISQTTTLRDQSYKTLQKSRGSLILQQERILECLKQNPQGLSNQELENKLCMRISSVTARINELRKQGLVTSGGARINNITDKLNAVWILNGEAICYN